MTVEEVTYTQALPAPVEEVEDPSLLVGQQEIRQEGADGLEERTDRVVRCRGEEQSRETLSAVTLTQPLPQIIAVGTGQGAEGAKGRFQWPCEGRISSPFGARTLFGSADFHRGTDIAASLGTPIAAGADGVVIWSGTKGSYGNLVIVDHQNGYLTYYAHCSQLLVQAGDQVAQGQTIALVGSTGRSTGPHCHYEIRWQEEPLDPALCLS
jgi:murein DD-endopeptidase MepM/ murein hydrolase activator NlpD